MTAPLKPALSFIEGETLSGYVSRNAKLHETTPRDFCSDLGMRWPHLCSGHDAQIERLAWLTGEPLEVLRNWRTQKIRIGRYRVGRADASTGILRRTAVRLCPQCVTTALSETGPQGVFQMLEWSVLCIHRCARHGCPLITLPSAAHSHATYDFVARVLEHKEEVRRASDVHEVLRETRLESYIRSRIWHGPKDDWLKAMDLTQIHRASLTLGAAQNGFKGTMPVNLSKSEERSLCEIGFQSLAGGKDTFKAALADLHRASTTERPYYSADMGPFYHWLREVHTQSALAEMVQITRSHVFDTYPTQLDKDVFGAKPRHQQWLTMEDARKRSGFGSVFLKRLLGYLNEVPKHEALKRTDVHVSEVERANAYWSTLINLKDSAAKLCILPTQVKALQNRGVLSSIKITSSLRYLLSDEVDGLLKARDGLPSALPGKSVVPLKEFCRSKGVHLARMIALWHQGELEGKVCRGDGDGLQALELEWGALCGRTAIHLDRDLELSETASYLQISVISIRRLRDAGYLEVISRRNPDTNHYKRYITKQSISAFEQQYVTLGQLAHDRKERPIHLARKLDRDGIAPINCSAGPVRVYAKDVLDGGYSENAC